MAKIVLMIWLWTTSGPLGSCQSDQAATSQSSPGPPSNGSASQTGWHITWVPIYLWLSGVNGYVGMAGRTIPVNASFSEVFDRVNIGYMTAVDVRKNRVGVLTDFQYLGLSSEERETPFGLLYSTAHADSQQYILDPEIYGRVFEGPKGYVDVLSGIRYWHLRSSLDLRPGLLPEFNASDSRNWVDPVMGGRFRTNLKRGYFAMLKGDAGGFGAGSDLTWQVYTGAGKEFKEKYSLFLGYRHLKIDYRDGGFIYDLNMNGMLLGFAINFK